MNKNSFALYQKHLLPAREAPYFVCKKPPKGENRVRIVLFSKNVRSRLLPASPPAIMEPAGVSPDACRTFRFEGPHPPGAGSAEPGGSQTKKERTDGRMKHYIIVKFTEGTDYRALERPVRELFELTLSIPGIHGVDVRLSNSDRPNRYDMMIVMDMEKDALRAYDVCEPHLRWKAEYGDRIAKKAIFDCDDAG